MAGLLDGKVAIITGSGGGIGRAEALLFAKEGAKVVVNDVGGTRSGEGASSSMADAVVDEIKKAGGQAVAHHESIADARGAESLIKTAVDAFGRVDTLVNNAGILRDKSLLKLDESMWDAVIAVHLKGTFLCTQVFARQLVAQGGGGRIVNTTSVSGMLGNFGQANYAAAKAGIYGLTRTAAIELQKHRITVNCIAPAALFLASDLCGDVTGTVLAVAGARMYAYKVMESPGKFKDENAGVWTANEIKDHWDAITKFPGT